MGAYSAPPEPLAGLSGPTSKERGMEMGGEGDAMKRHRNLGLIYCALLDF